MEADSLQLSCLTTNAVLAGLQGLRDLNLTGCRNIINAGRPLPGLPHLTRLTSLSVRNCEGLSDGALAALTRLSGLKVLDLSGCQNLSGVGYEPKQWKADLHT